MATVFRAFGSDLVNYLATIETDRLTAAMVGDTIDIFESLAAIFIPLLKSRGRKVKCMFLSGEIQNLPNYFIPSISARNH
jgi:hypothetical protein